MSTFIITGNYTADAIRGMIAHPSNREKAVAGMVDAMGGKILNFYVTSGETDFMLILEAEDGADVVPALMVAGASGTVSNLKTVRAFNAAEFVAMQERAGEIQASYQPAT